MREPRCTIDSSCLIALQHIGILPKLSFIYSTVLLPKAVRDEFSKRRVSKDYLRSILRDYAFFKRCDDFEKGTVDVLLVERRREGAPDRGEAEAVVQASQVGASVIVDDQWGRKMAAGFNLDYHGTFWVLKRLQELELISPVELRNHFLALREFGIRLPWENVNSLLANLGEAPLTEIL